MSERPHYRGLELALQVVGYRWAGQASGTEPIDPIAALEEVRDRAGGFPDRPVPLHDAYPALVELAAASLAALAVMPHPDEVDGLSGFEGFALWQQSHRAPPPP